MMYSDLISARIIADSVSPEGVRMTTMEIEYPRFILAELNTHRMLSKNSASSRAIPLEAMHRQLREFPAGPVHWGRNQSGMQADEELAPELQKSAAAVWQLALDSGIEYSSALGHIGVHKQIANRVTEPWMLMKTVISGTEWQNLFWLRNHSAAQPEFRVLAQQMAEALEYSSPEHLSPGEWHVPYVDTYRDPLSSILYYRDASGTNITAAQARIISASCCAQVSYRKNDNSYEKALKIYRQLVESEPVHASPVEHQATPMDLDSTCRFEPETWEPGVSHVSANSDLWSGNLRGWIQHRKLIRGEAQW